jgi:hypothetical protein
MLAVWVIGYGAGLAGPRHVPLTFALTTLIAMALWITIDLDRPRAGLIRLSDAPLEALNSSESPRQGPLHRTRSTRGASSTASSAPHPAARASPTSPATISTTRWRRASRSQTSTFPTIQELLGISRSRRRYLSRRSRNIATGLRRAAFRAAGWHRSAQPEFIERYNAEWLVERHHHCTRGRSGRSCRQQRDETGKPSTEPGPLHGLVFAAAC